MKRVECEGVGDNDGFFEYNAIGSQVDPSFMRRDVTRFDHDLLKNCDCLGSSSVMYEDENGGYVTYEDYEKLQKEITYLDKKIESAMKCHPRAVEILLLEAKTREHLDI